MAGAVLPDVLASDLRLIFCGTAPSRVSMRARAYYANPGNGFWRALHDCGLTPGRLRPEAYRELLALGIGLTDLNKTEWGNDDELSPAACDVAAFVAKMRRHRPRAVAFTSKTAAALFFGRPTAAVGLGRQEGTLDGAALFVLPSTSGQARRWFTMAPWHELARAVGDVPP